MPETTYTIEWYDDRKGRQTTMTTDADFADTQSRAGARVTASTQ